MPQLLHQGTRQQYPDKASGGICGIVKAYVFRCLFGARIRQDQIGMQRGNHGEGDAENDKSDHQNEVRARKRLKLQLERVGYQDRQDCRNESQKGAPNPCRGDLAAQPVGAASDERRRQGLHHAVTDRP